jgi:hypothetical protein
MATIHGEVNSSKNGTVPSADDARYDPTEPGIEATTAASNDRRANEDRQKKLVERVAHFTKKCVETRTALNGAMVRADGIPEHGRGWPLLMVALLALVTIALEYYPASLFTLVFMAKDNVHTALTWIFTAIGTVLALILGELLRRTRVPERPHAIDTVFVFVVGAVTLAFLYLGYVLRVAYTTAMVKTLIPQLGARQEAIALTAVATVGILLTVITAYYREGLESFSVNRRIRKLRGDLTAFEANEKKNQTDLDRTIDAAKSPAERAAERDAAKEQRQAELAAAAKRAADKRAEDEVEAAAQRAERAAARAERATASNGNAKPPEAPNP